MMKITVLVVASAILACTHAIPAGEASTPAAVTASGATAAASTISTAAPATVASTVAATLASASTAAPVVTPTVNPIQGLIVQGVDTAKSFLKVPSLFFGGKK